MATPRPLRATVVAIVVLTSGLLAGCVSSDVPEVPAGDTELSLGRDVWSGQCVACHGSDGAGGRGDRLNRGLVLDRYPDPATQLELIRNGVRAMPAFGGRLSDEELAAVVRYTREVIAVQE